ncbi:MAG: polysaccharide deacetylase family protein [Propionibacteriaceae bacterium]|nr:polysaccharide deacetylase family protein [Propionibacteriaceae bacterium]
MLRIFTGALALALTFIGITAAPARADMDIYTTPGEHVSGGREWRTWCEPYSQTARCTTQIKSGGDWVFNNLTYLPSPRELWASNPLGTPGEHKVAGRTWRTECDTARTGRNGCRSYLWNGKQFVFNNIVHFGTIRTDLGALYGYRPAAGPAPTRDTMGTTQQMRGPNHGDKVILTFDDCPKSLDAFKATVKAVADAGVRLALFPTGNCLTAGRFDVSYALKHGHYVFNHSISHPKLTTVSYAEAVRQLGAPGVVTTWGRPPYGDYNASVLKAYKAVGMQAWLWNLDTLDYRKKSSSELISFVVSHAKAGDTVLMHMQWHGFNGPTVAAMKDGLKARGIGVCANNGPVSPKPTGPLDC